MFDVLAGVIQQRRAQQRQDDRLSGLQIQLRMIIALFSRVFRKVKTQEIASLLTADY
jgi:hypothetical protein